MMRFTGWTTAFAATALLAGPVAVSAQQTSPAPASRPAAAGEQGSAHEHLNQAKTAVNDIPAASLTGTAKTSVAELKRRLSTLETSAAESHAPAAAAKPSARAASSWATEVAAIDRILNELLGADSATGAAAPVGTTGSKSAAAVALDDAARTKLQEVRTHVTAFAAAMSGNASASSDSADTPAANAAPAEPTASPASPSTATTTGARPEPTTPEPTTPEATASAATAAQSATTPAQAEPAAQPEPAQQAQVDPDTVKRHLTAARDSLSQITQLPAATQLTGDARTQVSQLIANFNELITTTTEWRASYAKVQANLTALVGDQTADESAATPATGTPGAVGTSGSVAIDPTIKAKLIEFRTHLLAFEKAAGAASATSMSASQSQPAATTAPSAASTTSPSEPAATTTATAPTAGSTAASQATAGTTGTTSAAASANIANTTTATEPEQSRPSTAAPQSAAGTAAQQSGHAEAMRHIEAIDAILNGRAAGSATAGTTGTTATVTTLDRDKIEQIKTHLAELRRALAQSGGR